MATNPVVNSLTFVGAVAGQASIQAQGIAGGLTFLLPNTTPVVGQYIDVAAVNGNNVFLGWVSPNSNIALANLDTTGASTGDVIYFDGTQWTVSTFMPGSGTVTSVSIGSFSPLFTTNVATPTSTPNATFTAVSQSQNLVFASPDGASGAAAFRALVVADLPSLAASDLSNGATGSGAIVLETGATISGATLSGTLDASTATFSGNTTFSGTQVTFDHAVQANSLNSLGAGFNILDSSSAGLSLTESGTGGITLTDNSSGGISATSATGNIALTASAGTVTLSGTSVSAPNLTISESQVTNLTTDLAAKAPLASPALTGTATVVNIQISGALEDGSASAGTSGQLLSSTVTGTAWIDQSSLAIAGTQVTGNISGNAASITGSITESQVTNLTSDLALKAPLASPPLTGTPTAPTATALTDTTQIATTQYADTKASLEGNGANGQPALADRHIATGNNITLPGTSGTVSYIAGSVTTGTFQSGDTLTQTSTGATATFQSLSWAGGLIVTSVSGAPDNTNIWTGSPSGATFTPTAVPVAADSSNWGATVTLTSAAAYSAASAFSIQVTRVGSYAGTGQIGVHTVSGTQFIVTSSDGAETTPFFWTCFGKTASD